MVIDTEIISLDEARALSMNVLTQNGFSDAHASAITRTICAAQRDECHSHGLYRLLVCVRSLQTGKVDGNAVPIVTDQSTGIVRVDARQGYSLTALEAGAPLLIEKTKQSGVAALIINNCFHFSALWPEVEYFANMGLASLAMNPSHSWVAPAGGKWPVLGTNPIAFGWPRPAGENFVFDFATSAVARGEIELHQRTGQLLAEGLALDREGNPTVNPNEALEGAMVTFGGHKGSALSIMIELLAGPLIGDLTSMESQRIDDHNGASPFHGELIIAFDPEMLGGGGAVNVKRAEALFDAIVTQGARLPSQRRYDARARTLARGAVSIPKKLLEEIRNLLLQG